jgi:hypothetical protein
MQSNVVKIETARKPDPQTKNVIGKRAERNKGKPRPTAAEAKVRKAKAAGKPIGDRIQAVNESKAERLAGVVARAHANEQKKAAELPADGSIPPFLKRDGSTPAAGNGHDQGPARVQVQALRSNVEKPKPTKQRYFVTLSTEHNGHRAVWPGREDKCKTFKTADQAIDYLRKEGVPLDWIDLDPPARATDPVLAAAKAKPASKPAGKPADKPAGKAPATSPAAPAAPKTAAKGKADGKADGPRAKTLPEGARQPHGAFKADIIDDITAKLRSKAGVLESEIMKAHKWNDKRVGRYMRTVAKGLQKLKVTATKEGENDTRYKVA